MSDTQKLTPADPVDEATRLRLGGLTEAHYDIASQLYELEQRKVQLLVAGQRVDQEKVKLFEKILMDRGLPPNSPVEIDSQTGVLKLLRPVAKPVEGPPAT